MMQLYFIHYSDVRSEGWSWTHFSPKELACKCCGELLVDTRALDMLQDMRNMINNPLTINSSYRCAVHNKDVGGKRLSMHRLARAFDISIEGKSKEFILQKAQEAGFTGFGFYNNFIHVDTGNKRTWGSWRKIEPYIDKGAGI